MVTDHVKDEGCRAMDPGQQLDCAAGEECKFVPAGKVWDTAVPYVNQCTDLVALRAGSFESHEKIFPTVFPRLSLIFSRFRCQKWILRIILNISTCSKKFQRLKISSTKLSLKIKSPKPRICLISLYITLQT